MRALKNQTNATRALRKQINQCFGSDRAQLHKKLNQIERSSESPEQKISELRGLIEKSKSRIELRSNEAPKIEYPTALPVVEARDTILEAIKNNQVTIICGETGSGKTTQLPKMCLELGRGTRGFIGHTQPRRIAARSVAARIAEEMKTEVGKEVGFKVRFSDQVNDDSYLKLMTDGILLTEIQSDRWLNQYDTIIIDEAHERSLNIDFLLGVLKQLLPKRRDLKLIITSATIDPERFSRHFNDAPVISVEGRTYPVEVRYQSIDGGEEEAEQNLSDTVVDNCESLIAECRGQPGDILVFLPGERHIRECADALGKSQAHSKAINGVEIVPLFARLTAAEQAKIFSSHSRRRIILSTNIAETSLTVPGIRFVVDSGMVRLSRYSLRSKVQRLPIEKISQASANQRKGRCGREGPGICVRLYTEEDFESRPLFTDPEILRTNLAAVVLQMESLKLGAVSDFPFVEKPDNRLVRDGYQLLFELGAVNEKNRLTPLGKKLTRLPIEPRLARMLFAAVEENCVMEILTIASALSVMDPRERPQEKQQAADALHAEFKDEQSDFGTWLNLWEFIDVQWQALSHSKFRKMCKARFLSYIRIREWQDVRKQLQRQVKALKLHENSEPANYAAIHRSVLSGLLANVCIKDEKNSYLGTRNRKLKIFPGSGLRKKQPKWIVAGEISETSELFARSAAKVEVEWIEKQSAHLLKYSYSQPRWEKKRGQVGAKEKSTLYGLTINPGKWINYGPKNATEAREIFIRDGLVAGQVSTNAAFYRHNLELIDEVLLLESKFRRRDILVSPDELVRFYDNIIPVDVYSLPLFERWRKAFEEANPRGLFFARSTVIEDEREPEENTDFPDQLELGSAVFALTYSFSPGSDNDGVTLTIPVSVLNRVDPKLCEWLVPGLLLEKVTALIKSLPKPLRRNFVPAPDFARQCIATFGGTTPNESLHKALSRYLSSLGRCRVEVNDFELGLLPEHLLMRYEVINAEGKQMRAGRDFASISAGLEKHTVSSLSQIVAPTFERSDIDDWNFGDLPDTVEVEEPAGNSVVKLLGFPALQKLGDKISVCVFPTQALADAAMQYGLLGLFQKVMKNEYRYITNRMNGMDALSLIYAPFGSREMLQNDLADAVFSCALLENQAWPRTRDAFYKIIAERQKTLIPLATKMVEFLDTALREYQRLSRRISKSNQLSWVEPLQDIREQLDHLFAKGFIGCAGDTWLRRYPVYLNAIMRRLDAIDKAPEQDRRKRAELLPLWEQFKQLPKSKVDTPNYASDYASCRWRIEELRVSLFAQSLGTVEKVSVQRVENSLKKLQSG